MIVDCDTLLDGVSPTPSERRALEEVLAEFERDPRPGELSRDAIQQIREYRRSAIAAACCLS